MIKQILNYDGYFISDDGIPQSNKRGSMKPLKIVTHNNLPFVYLNSKNMKSVRRLVADAFVPNPHNLAYVKNIDGNVLNNRADNIIWCDAIGNTGPTDVQVFTARNGAKWLVPKSEFEPNYKLLSKASDPNLDDVELEELQRPVGMHRAVLQNFRKGQNLSKEDIEDAYMDAIMMQYEHGNGKAIDTRQLHNRVRTKSSRKLYEKCGLTQNGTIPKDGYGFHILNELDAEGNNRVEEAAIDQEGNYMFSNDDDSYDEPVVFGDDYE